MTPTRVWRCAHEVGTFYDDEETMNAFRKFWLVWSPTGTKTPSHRHPSQPEAAREAERLARMAPGAEFYVLETMARVSKTDVTWSKATEDDDGIPF